MMGLRFIRDGVIQEVGKFQPRITIPRELFDVSAYAVGDKIYLYSVEGKVLISKQEEIGLQEVAKPTSIKRYGTFRGFYVSRSMQRLYGYEGGRTYKAYADQKHRLYLEVL